ncbi:MAG: response regulator [Patescibacteria group bacterium]
MKILLVEDNKDARYIINRLLQKNGFKDVVMVENGKEALEVVEKENFSLILMDIRMPVMDGFEATKKIREMPGYKETPIIAVTAYSMKGDREECLEAGATDYLSKPFDNDDFVELVKKYTSDLSK